MRVDRDVRAHMSSLIIDNHHQTGRHTADEHCGSDDAHMEHAAARFTPFLGSESIERSQR